MTAALTVAAVPYQALDGGVPANVPEHVRHIEDAHSHGAHLVVFPELSLTGYDRQLPSRLFSLRPCSHFAEFDDNHAGPILLSRG